MRKKITVIGAGNVGAACAWRLADREITDVILLDIVDGLAAGKALDMMEAMPVTRRDLNISGTSNYADTAGSDVIIVTSGLARKPGMSRDDLLIKNSEIVYNVTKSAIAQSPDAFVIVVSNPLDAMTWAAWKASGLPTHKVMGMAGILDTARYRSFISEELNVSVKDIQAMLLGGHGDSMVPLPRYTTIGGIPLTELLDINKIDSIVDRTRKGGIEIVNLLKTGSAYYAPGVAAAEMAEAIILDQKRILPCCVWAEDVYENLGKLFVGLPAVLGAGGVEKVIELKLDEHEFAMLKESAKHVQDLLEKVEPELPE